MSPSTLWGGTHFPGMPGYQAKLYDEHYLQEKEEDRKG